MGNKWFPESCAHIQRGTLEHAETVTSTTTPDYVNREPNDYAYQSGPDTIRLCVFCTGVMRGTLSKAGESAPSERSALTAVLAALEPITPDERERVLHAAGLAYGRYEHPHE